MKYIGLILAAVLLACVFWEPATFFGNHGKIPAWQAILLVWAVCTAVIGAFGLKPVSRLWQYFFYLPAAIIVMIGFVLYFINENNFHL